MRFDFGIGLGGYLGPHLPAPWAGRIGADPAPDLGEAFGHVSPSVNQAFTLSLLQCPGFQEPFRNSTTLPIRFSAMEPNWTQITRWALGPAHEAPWVPPSTPSAPSGAVCLSLLVAQTCTECLLRHHHYHGYLWSKYRSPSRNYYLFIIYVCKGCVSTHAQKHTCTYVNHLYFWFGPTTEVYNKCLGNTELLTSPPGTVGQWGVVTWNWISKPENKMLVI